jgi:hypothetical protein
VGVSVQSSRPPALAEVDGYATTVIFITNTMLMCRTTEVLSLQVSQQIFISR